MSHRHPAHSLLLTTLALSVACDAPPSPDEDLEIIEEELQDAESSESADGEPVDPDADVPLDLDAGVVLGQTVVAGPDGPIVLTYENRDGIAIVDGDIELGPVELLPEPEDVDLAELDALSIGEQTDEQGFTPVPVWGQAWPNGVVYYVTPNTGSAVLDQRILNQIATIESSTNFDFIPIPVAWSSLLDHIFFTGSFYVAPGTGTSDSIGRKGGRQYIRFSAVDVLTGNIPGQGLILHEMGHALGLHHEHQRPDRDDFVLYLPFCVQSGMGHNFEKRVGFVWGPYDAGSLMHYQAGTFGAGCNPLMSLTGATLGSSGSLTSGDIAALNWAANW